MIAPHSHTCASCGFTWACLLVAKPRQRVCVVDAARAVNHTGPFCELCRTLTEASRVALVRHVSPIQLTAALLERYHAEKGGSDVRERAMDRVPSVRRRRSAGDS
jgi:hypothetical protein